MSTHKVMPVTRNPFHKERYAINDKLPSATSHRRLADGFNHVLGLCKKQWTCRAMDLSNVSTPGATDVAIWNTDVHTGEGTDSLLAYVGLVKTDAAVVFGLPPTFKIEIYPAGGGALVTSREYTFNQRSTGATVEPDDINHTVLRLEGLSPNTAYQVLVTRISGARAVYMTLVEGRKRVVSTATTGACDAGAPKLEADITDDFIAELIDANNKLWRHNGAPLLCWTADREIAASGGSAGVSVISGNTSYTDIEANPRYFTLDTRYHLTLMRTTIPVKVVVTSNRISGTGTLDVRLTDGTNHLAVTGIADGGAYGHTTRFTATGTLPAALTSTWHLEARQSNALTTHELYSFIVFPYEV